MGNFFKVRLTAAIINKDKGIWLEAISVYVTVSAFQDSDIWRSIFKLTQYEKYRIVSFRFLASYECKLEYLGTQKGLFGRYFFENEKHLFLDFVSEEEIYPDVTYAITNHYCLQIEAEGLSECYDEIYGFKENIFCNSHHLLFGLFEDENLPIICGINIHTQCHLDANINTSAYFPNSEEEPLDDFLLSLGRSKSGCETEIIELTEKINILLDYETKWYDLSRCLRRTEVLRDEEFEKLKREIKIISLLNQ